MSHHVEIRSRSGNVALGAIGAIYFIGAVATLLLYVWTVWGAAGPLDRLLQFALIVSALAGAAFLVIAADNLGVIRSRRRQSGGSPTPRTAAAA